MEENMTPELKDAIIRALYHHPKTTPIIVRILTGRAFDTPPPLPTDEEKKQTETIVEELVAYYFKAFRNACIEVTGEDPEKDWD